MASIHEPKVVMPSILIERHDILSERNLLVAVMSLLNKFIRISMGTDLEFKVWPSADGTDMMGSYGFPACIEIKVLDAKAESETYKLKLWVWGQLYYVNVQGRNTAVNVSDDSYGSSVNRTVDWAADQVLEWLETQSS